MKRERIIACWKGKLAGPTTFIIGGLHGNEHSGIKALENCKRRFEEENTEFRGTVFFIIGNLKASEQGVRFIKADLNRLWKTHEVSKTNADDLDNEWLEMKELKEIIDPYVIDDQPLNVFDLHTTSAPTIPFIVIEDELQSLEFVSQFQNVPAITRLKNFLSGTLLSYYSNRGASTLAYEAGDHHSATSILSHEAFIKLALIKSKNLLNFSKNEVKRLNEELEDELMPKHTLFELVDRYEIKPDESFEMLPGFSNFQKIFKGEQLARNQDGYIESAHDANIFMPLYQKKGNDGFFVIQPLELN